MEPKINEYETVRGQIMDGDVILFEGIGFLSAALHWRKRPREFPVWKYLVHALVSTIVKAATGSKYSHAGLAARWYKRLMVLEAIGDGVIVNPLRRSQERFKAKIYWFSCEEISPKDRELMMIKALEELGKPYGFWKTILFLICLIFKIDVDKRDSLKKAKSIYCSEYVARVYNAVHKDLKKGRADQFMSPKDIADSPLLTNKGILKMPLTDRPFPS
jgi:hypothetical protein